MEQRPIGYLATVLRVLGYLRPHRARFGAGLGLTAVGIVLDLVKPWPLAVVLDKVLGATASGVPGQNSLEPLPAWLSRFVADWPPTTMLATAAAAIAVIALIHGIVGVASNYITIDIGQRMVSDLRTELYAHLQKLSLKFHFRQTTGDLLFRVMADTFSIQSMVMNGLLPLISAAIMLGAMFWVMASYDGLLAVVTLLVCPPLFIAIKQLSHRIHGHASASREAESELYARAESTIGAVKLVQAYGREEGVVADFRRGSERSLALSLRLYSTETVFGLVVDSVLAIGTAAVVWLGAKHVLSGVLTVGQLTIFLSYLKDLYGPIHNISQNLAEVSAARAGLERAFSVLDEQPDIQDKPGAKPIGAVRGEVALEGVTFGYDPAVPVLNDVTLKIAPGEKIALVGRTGAGKTTLASLVLRFFDPQAGRVAIDGCDLRDVTLASLRSRMTLMLQEPILFHTSVADNIAYGAANGSLDNVKQAARRAEADEFIQALPNLYDTVIGQDGLTLSGGQRQRLALARALLRDTPIVILDEPTSSLDMATESLVWQNVEELLRGKTAIIIAHRLSTARMADRIVVLDAGRIIEHGPHDALVAAGGPYARLWQRHAADPSAKDTEPPISEWE